MKSNISVWLPSSVVYLSIPDIPLHTQAAEIDLNDMPYAEGARFDIERCCLPGTREEAIREISNWVIGDGDDGSRIFFFCGFAGTGKSAIAHTISRQFDEIGRLGSSFCFDRSHSADRRPDTIFSTIARDLADLDPRRKDALWQVIREKRALRTTHAIREQFEKFILKPSADLASIGPIVIVIDALDECGDPASRKALLSILADKVGDLPPNFRFLITARPEQDIMDALSTRSHVTCRHMDAIDTKSTTADIYLYVQAQLGDVPSLERKWPNRQWCNLLVERSESLFQWAFTACRFVKGDGKRGLDPVEQLNIVISSKRRGGSLDQLYLDVLTQTFDASDSTAMARWKMAMGRVLAAKQPLSVSALRELRYGEDSVDAIGLIISPLGSLLSGANEESIPVRPLHTSFLDFLTDASRSGPFFIDVSLHDRILALSSLRIMKSETGLRFNICKLETSYIRNDDVPNLQMRIEKAITPLLSYSCRFWSDHLRTAPFDSQLLVEVKDFLNVRLLYWLEVLSLIKEVNRASKALLSIVEWSTVEYLSHPRSSKIPDSDAQDENLKSFAKDARKFVSAFGSVIAHSVPHIYLSALPFAPEESELSRCYLPQYPQTLTLKSGKASVWPAIQIVLEGHSDTVNSVAISKDGKYILSGSDDQTIRVWDMETGDIVLGPLDAHTDAVKCVDFSPDGKQIMSGSDDQTIRLWDANTGNLVRALEGHTGAVLSIAFSRDGNRIVSGSADETIRVWDAHTGAVTLGPLEGHTEGVRSVVFSQDGKFIVSGSADNTICVWDAHNGSLSLGPLEEHDDAVNSVAISQDGKRILSGSDDATIAVWDAETGNVVLGPLQTHPTSVNSVTFSHDDKYIVSGAEDRVIFVCDAETGEIVRGPLEGHTDAILHVARSDDGKRFASTSYDWTVRVWDAETGGVSQRSWSGHTSAINSISLSPDGTRIASGADDKTIRVWNLETWDTVLGPLQREAQFVNSVVFSQDGNRIISGADDAIHIWDSETGSYILGPLEEHTDTINAVAISKDGKRIVSASDDETIRMWDGDTGAVVLGPLEKHTGAVNCIALSPNGKHIVSGSDDHAIWVWDAETGNAVKGPLTAQTQQIYCVAFSPDGNRIVSGSSGRTIRVRDVETGDVVLGPLQGHTNTVRSIQVSPDGKRIVSGSDDRSIMVWDAQNGAVLLGPLKGHSDVVSSVGFSADGKRIVSGSGDKEIRVWDAVTGEIVLGPLGKHSESVTSVAFSQDGKRLVSGSSDRTVRVWNAETGDVLLDPLRGHTAGVRSVVFSQDGKRIASSSEDRTIRVWSADTGDCILGPLQGHSGWIYSITFSSDGRRILSGSSDATIRVWDGETGAVVLGPLKGHKNQVYSVALSPNGKVIASGSIDETIRLWDAETGAAILGPLEEPPTHDTQAKDTAGVSMSGHSWDVRCLAFSPNGKQMISGANDCNILVWNTETWEVELALTGHTLGITALAFSRDGQRIISGASDSSIRVWDATTGALILGPLEGHMDTVTSVTFSGDDKHIVSASADGTIRVWDANPTIPVNSGSVLDVSSVEWRDGTTLKNGWMQNSPSMLLFWVPPWNRIGLWRPRNVTVIAPVLTILDFSRFAHGTSWEECRKVEC